MRYIDMYTPDVGGSAEPISIVSRPFGGFNISVPAPNEHPAVSAAISAIEREDSNAGRIDFDLKAKADATARARRDAKLREDGKLEALRFALHASQVINDMMKSHRTIEDVRAYVRGNWPDLPIIAERISNRSIDSDVYAIFGHHAETREAAE